MDNEQKKLITEWIQDAHFLLKCHLSLAESTRRKHQIIGILSAVLSAIVGSSIFATLGQEGSTVSRTIILTTGLISLLATVLTSVLAFLKLPEQANQYHNSGNEYAAIRRELEYLLSFDSEDPEHVKNEVSRIRVKWDEIRKNSIPISNKVVKKISKRINGEVVLN